mmetsp:Transcript_55435/g.168489  ORF Transcript_55435/g.168489 Transcript_55435/m.168489 type:complete len:260 (+) Transcript_55435:833-1612(+)
MLQNALLDVLEALELMKFVEDHPVPKELLKQGELQLGPRRNIFVSRKWYDPLFSVLRHCSRPLEQALRGCHGFRQTTELAPPLYVHRRIQKPVRAQDNIGLGQIRCLCTFEAGDIGQRENIHGALARGPAACHVTSQRIAIVHEFGNLCQPLVEQVAWHDDQRTARGDKFAGVTRRQLRESPRMQRAIDEADRCGGLSVADLVGQDAALHIVECRGPELQRDRVQNTHDVAHSDALIVAPRHVLAAKIGLEPIHLHHLL